MEDGIEMNKPQCTELCDNRTGVAMSVTSETAGDGTVRIVRRISIPQKVFSVDEYAAVRNIITAWLDRSALLFTGERQP